MSIFVGARVRILGTPMAFGFLVPDEEWSKGFLLRYAGRVGTVTGISETGEVAQVLLDRRGADFQDEIGWRIVDLLHLDPIPKMSRREAVEAWLDA